VKNWVIVSESGYTDRKDSEEDGEPRWRCRGGIFDETRIIGVEGRIVEDVEELLGRPVNGALIRGTGRRSV
jgi:hypothetical protein